MAQTLEQKDSIHQAMCCWMLLFEQRKLSSLKYLEIVEVGVFDEIG